MYYSSACYLSICVEMHLRATLIRRLELKLICLHWFLCIPFSFLGLWYWIRHRLFLFLHSENQRLPDVDIILDKYLSILSTISIYFFLLIFLFWYHIFCVIFTTGHEIWLEDFQFFCHVSSYLVFSSYILINLFFFFFLSFLTSTN